MREQSHKMRAETLGQSPDYFESIVQTVREPLIVLDADLRVKTANLSFYRTFQVSQEETINNTVFELGNSQWDMPALRHLLDEILSKNIEFHDFEVEHEFPAIGRRIMLLNARRIEGTESHARMILLAIEDVTERKRAQDKLKVYAAKLERSNRELQDFAQVASHDLQEPLRKIQAFGERLKTRAADSLNEESRDYLERMLHASARMQVLISDLLVFSRLETKARPFITTDLGAVVREVISDLEARVEQTGGRVETGELPTVEADSMQMRQLFQNLIGNALKYHRTGIPPVVKVYAEVFSERRHEAHHAGHPAEPLCQVFVEDNGIGFDEKYLDRIFTIFQRLHGRKEYEGTGIGLAVCRKIAERHNGTITAKSRPGIGSTFIVTLPFKHTREESGIL